jgi:hypothetical protein
VPEDCIEPSRDRTVTAFKFKVAILLVLGVAHLVVTLVAVVPGYMNIDEALNHWMTKNMAYRGALDLWNGFDEFPSVELQHPFVSQHQGKLYPPYPYLYPLLATPLFLVFGYFGLFVFNALAFLGLALLCFLIARRLFGDVDLALNACLLLALSSFAWEYSQAAWPHVVSMLFVAGEFALFLAAYNAVPRRNAILPAFATGLVAGAAMGIRIDTVLVFPALFLPFLFARPWRPVEAIAVFAGMVPGVCALAAVNLVKFGEFNPLSYGGSLGGTSTPSIGVLAAAGVLVLTAWILTRSQYRESVIEHWKILVGLALAICVAAMVLVPNLQESIGAVAANARTSLLDMSTLDPNTVFPPMKRTDGGGVIYLGGHKKALLQSMPYLVLLIVPIVSLFRNREDFARLVVLSLPPLLVLGYNTYAWIDLEGGGGMCLNARYLLPSIPFLCILCAYGINELKTMWGPGGSVLFSAMVIAATAGGFFLILQATGPELNALEFPILHLPLIIAGMLLGFICACYVIDIGRIHFASRLAWAILYCAAAWAGAVSFLYDYPKHRFARSMNLAYGKQLLRVIPDDSLFVAWPGYFTASLKLIEKDRIRLAYGARDNFRSFPNLARFHIDRGRRVFVAFPNGYSQRLHPKLLENLKVRPVLVFRSFFVGEVFKRRQAP